MIKKAISIATILLFILGVGIVLTKASPQVGRYKADNQRVDRAGNNTGGLAVREQRLKLVEELGQRAKVDLQNARVLVERVYGNVSREMPNRLVGDEVSNLRGVVAYNVPALPDARYRDNHLYLTSRRNLLGEMQHLSEYSHLAVYNLRVYVPRQLDNVFYGLRPDYLQKVTVFRKVEGLKALPFDDARAALALTSFEAPGLKALRHEVAANAKPLVQENTVTVTGKLSELDLAVT